MAFNRVPHSPDAVIGSWAGKPLAAGKAEEIARDLAPNAWQFLSAGEGAKGARLHDWAYCELTDLAANEYDETKSGLWTRGLFDPPQYQRRRSCFLHNFAKNELSLDHNETRS